MTCFVQTVIKAPKSSAGKIRLPALPFKPKMNRRILLSTELMLAIALSSHPLYAQLWPSDLTHVTSADTKAANALWIENPLDLQFKSTNRVVVANIKGPAEITMMHFALPGARKLNRDLLLRIYWDGETNPSVDCPLVDFYSISWNADARSQRGQNWGGEVFYCRASPKELGFELTLPKKAKGILRLYIIDPDGSGDGRKETIIVGGETVGTFEHFQEGRWVEVPVVPDKTTEGTLSVQIVNALQRVNAVLSKVEWLEKQ
jgi:hypothetical protein